jgi:deoxyribodipyrimidine photo-lyase
MFIILYIYIFNILILTYNINMSEHKKYCLHIFRRDYRLFDNTSLIKASKEYDEVIPIFIFTYKQIRDNPYKSDICVKFLIDSLKELNNELKTLNSRLRVYYGDEFTIIKDIIKNNHNIKGISFNKDYTKYSQDRDAEIMNICEKSDINIISEDDHLLHPLGTISTTGGSVYTKFTPFYNKALSVPVILPDKYKVVNLYSKSSTLKGYKEYTAPLESFYDYNNIKHVIMPEKGGRKAGITILKEIKQGSWSDYNKNRDLLIYDTTHLSPYNKFGCISIREEYYFIKQSLGMDSGIIRQLIWRDFYYNLSSSNPHIYSGALNKKYDKIKWIVDITKWNAWTNARTGYPIVDACMMEIIKTGYMHNRGRLIVSNFLTRILSIDWRKGEKWFAQHLYDYDPTQNNFGWQVNAAVSGTESRPLSQTILNPWIQSKKYDPDTEYIKKWLPNLRNVDANHLHKWDKYHANYNLSDIDYLEPIVDYIKAKEYNIAMYKKYLH